MTPTQTKPTQAHTATPWDTGPNAGKHSWSIHSAATGKDIGLTSWTEQDEANAAFVVRACNSHEELLDVCKALLEDLRNDPHSAGYDSVALAEAAIARAESQ